jgi:NADPH:quinone reductase-like Zn-dependent oxidoreductase
MLAYTIQAGRGSDGLIQVDRPQQSMGSHDVRIAVSAAALNFRDIQVGRGSYDHAVGQPIVPLSDAVGEVVEVGRAVDRFAVGDRVLTTFFPRWIDGPISDEKTAVTYGAGTDGVLSKELVVSQEALVYAPADLSDAQAATLVCAGVTAWNALFVQGAVRPGAKVLILGTGGVAIWALQLAVAAGLDPIVTSSSDEKLEIARSVGAVGIVNYRTSPEWQEDVRRVTAGRGVDLVLEVGGENTLPRSIAATMAGGKVVAIGGLSGFGGASIEPHSLIFGAKTLAAVSVGSRSMLEDLVRFVDRAGLKPTVAREFGFDEAAAAYDYLEAGRAFGKVVIRVR